MIDGQNHRLAARPELRLPADRPVPPDMAKRPQGEPDQPIHKYPEHHGLISALNRVTIAIIAYLTAEFRSQKLEVRVNTARESLNDLHIAIGCTQLAV